MPFAHALQAAKDVVVIAWHIFVVDGSVPVRRDAERHGLPTCHDGTDNANAKDEPYHSSDNFSFSGLLLRGSGAIVITAARAGTRPRLATIPIVCAWFCGGSGGWFLSSTLQRLRLCPQIPVVQSTLFADVHRDLDNVWEAWPISRLAHVTVKVNVWLARSSCTVVRVRAASLLGESVAVVALVVLTGALAFVAGSLYRPFKVETVLAERACFSSSDRLLHAKHAFFVAVRLDGPRQSPS